MTRVRLALLALAALILLTGLTAWLVESMASPLLLAAIAVLKCLVVGIAFLELDKAWPIWGLLAALLVLAIAGGAALLTIS